MIEPHRIAQRFFNRPLLLTEPAASTIASFLLSRFAAARGATASGERPVEEIQAFAATSGPGGSHVLHSPRASRFLGEYRVGPDGRPTPYRVTEAGTAVITIAGELVNRGAWIGASSGLVSYEGIRHQVSTAVKDRQVSSILLDIESPGGEATGAFETAALIREAAAAKPLVAAVNGLAASAGYAIASGAARIVSLPTGLAGSIGVVMVHLDFSAALAAEGIAPTLIFAGARKVDGNPYEPLPEAVRDRFRSDVESFMGLFVDCVAAGRAGMTPRAIRDTEAGLFLGADAVDLGLVDEIAPAEEVAAALGSAPFRASLLARTLTATKGSPRMSTERTPGPVAGETVTVADALSALDRPETGAEDAPAPGPSAPARPEAVPDTVSRARVAEILEIAATATRLGVAVDARDAIARNIEPDALRKATLEAAAAIAEASAVTAVPTGPAAAGTRGESGPDGVSSIVAKARARADELSARRAR